MSDAVRPVRPEDVEVLGHVMAEAFFDDPVTRWLLPDEARRHEALSLGMGHVLRTQYQPRGGAWTTDAREGAALWGMPGDAGPGVGEQLAGIAVLARAFGRRLPRAMRAFGSVERRRPRVPHWYLDILAVRPDRQGRGVGSALVRVGTTRADRIHVPCFLATSNPRTLPLYRRLGFAVQDEYDVGPVRVWTMLRPAGGPPQTG
ncbi:MAG: GNAT family N-acetyltransferase [Thermoleophilia bacterium]|jgi:GNAT superfamily N-acetyltransferase|nr:GNAT family N-acetyltransferase [Thermoleophilia bacterium]